ncbi:hypothetical protein AVEN_97303-1, partial [Araneus ventricosus]
ASKDYDEESAKEWLNTIINERNEIRKEEIAERKQECEERKRKEEKEYEERKLKEEKECEERKRNVSMFNIYA